MPQVLTPYADLAAGEAIIDATKTWLERAVIGLNLCPFAKSVFVKKQVRYALTAAADADGLLAELEHELTLLAETDPEQLDTTLLIHPLAMTDFLEALSDERVTLGGKLRALWGVVGGRQR